ncbi:MAG: S24 family peptidase [Sphingobacterium sp.]
MNNRVIVNNDSFFNVVQQEISAGNTVRFQLKGNSMEPFLKDCQNILLAKVDPEKTAIGEIVLVTWKNKYLLHRIVYQNEHYLYLVGDNNLVQIEKVEKKNIIAIMKGSYEITAYKKFTFRDRIIGICWFMMRPFRRAKNLITRKLTPQKQAS